MLSHNDCAKTNHIVKTLIVTFGLIFTHACKNPQFMTDLSKNNLENENSPYLLQHASNPVYWQAWNEAIFTQAEELDKLVIISIGYSSCHWCHVMEHESFEDTAVAAIMNEKFVSIKVDREERPDVDDVYMTAAQLITGRGGWPLNVITLPDGRPVWAGTYVPKQQWKQVLTQLAQMYIEDRTKFVDYAKQLTQGIKQSQLIPLAEETVKFQKEDINQLFANWQTTFDQEEGGPNRAPKFPMPGALEFVLHYAETEKNQIAENHIKLTLEKMAFGGIYDQIGGGFARYSTDSYWKVPHFEKMLYDNAQLVSLYSKAYRKYKNPLYAEIVEETLEFVHREMTDKSGAFYSALDADSDGEEGKFYIWTADELKALIPQKDWLLFEAYYNVNQKGYWEHGNYILLRKENDNTLCAKFNLKPNDLKSKVTTWKQTLLQRRQQRPKPGLDDKSLTSWNALMLSAYLDAYKAFGNATYLAKAKANAKWIANRQSPNKQELFHAYKNGESYIEGLMEDYAFAIQAFLDLFEVTTEESYLDQAAAWAKYAKQNFEDSASGYFYTRNLNSNQLIAKSQETADNVIPGSNSVMAKNLFRLSHYLSEASYLEQAKTMLTHLKTRTIEYGESYYGWAGLMLNLSSPFYEVAISGSKAKEKLRELNQNYLPQTLVIAAANESNLELLQDRYSDETRIFVCQEKACKYPVNEVGEALELIKLN